MLRILARVALIPTILIVGTISLSLLSTSVVRGAINNQISFQGKLTNPDGTNVTNGNYSIAFTIYSGGTVYGGGSSVWTETQNPVAVTDGIFQVNLGSVTSLPGSVDFNTSNLFLAVKVGADPEMLPRITFTASPYAFNSDKLGGIAASGFVQLSPGAQQTGFINISGNATVGGTYNGNTFTSSALTFSAASNAVIQSAGSQAMNITGNAASTISTTAGNLTIQAGSGTVSLGTSTILNASGALAINSGVGTALTIDSGTTGALNIGTGANAKTITLGNTTGATAIATLVGAGTNAFSIQGAASAIYVQLDTTNNRLYVGNPAGDANGVLLVLDNKNTTSDPNTGVNGAMYYNSNEHSYRCYRGINASAADGAWETCGTQPIDRGYTQEEEFFTGGTTNGTIGKLGWNTTTIGGAPAYTYNNAAAPAPSAQRPGILRLRTAATANQGGTLSLGTASMAIGAEETIKAAIATTAVGAGTQAVRFGIHNETNNIARPTTGVWWEYDPAVNANWQYCYVNATPVAVCAASATAPTAQTFTSLEIRILTTGVNTSSAEYFVNGVKSSVSGITINTTNLVAPATTCYAVVNNTARDCFLDYVQIRGGSGAYR